MLHTDLKQLFTEERGVSPVIGVILMVAVTVVLAALIGAFVFGLGDDLGASAPNAQVDFSFDGSEDTVTVTHDGGQSITSENTGALFMTGDVDGDNIEWRDVLDPSEFDDEDDKAGVIESIAAGQEILVHTEITTGATMQLQWESPNGDQTATLGEFSAP